MVSQVLGNAIVSSTNQTKAIFWYQYLNKMLATQWYLLLHVSSFNITLLLNEIWNKFFFSLYNVKGAAHGTEGSKKKMELSLE